VGEGEVGTDLYTREKPWNTLVVVIPDLSLRKWSLLRTWTSFGALR